MYYRRENKNIKMEIIEKIKAKSGKIISYGLWLMIIILVISTVQNLTKVVRIKAEIEKERQKVEKMGQMNLDLERQLSEAQSVSFIEKQVRNRLGLVKDGETTVILPDEETVKKLAPQIKEEEDSLPDPNWKKWEKLFF
jgi:cell division protein FtsB